MRSGVAKHLRDAIFPLDCENCYINTCRVIEDNEIILDLYELLPSVYDINGIRTITAADVRSVFEIFDVSKGFWDDFYQRIMYLNKIITETELKIQEKEAEMKKPPASKAGRQDVTTIKPS